MDGWVHGNMIDTMIDTIQHNAAQDHFIWKAQRKRTETARPAEKRIHNTQVIVTGHYYLGFNLVCFHGLWGYKMLTM